MKRIEGAVRRAIYDFDLIQSGDVVAVGLSGGKDSLTLLAALAHMRRYLPQRFEVKALMVEMGFEGCSTADIAAYCASLDVEFITKQTDIATVVFDIRKEKNPCALCANMRRGALNKLAVESGCNKVALGHHFDDAIETFFLSLFYEGRLSCFQPKSYLDRTGITVIRPLIYVEERQIQNFAAREQLPILYNPCPANGNTKREDTKQLLEQLSTQYKDLKQHVFGAVKSGLFLGGLPAAGPSLDRADEKEPVSN